VAPGLAPWSVDAVWQEALTRYGVDLLADRWAPRHGADGLPTALVRTPYGRRGLFAAVLARPLAERGYAYRFVRGHRIRVQVSSGAFPRFARNTGTGDPIATATTLRAADQTVHHDPEHPSALILPVRVRSAS
jgi:predicted acyl esterase